MDNSKGHDGPAPEFRPPRGSKKTTHEIEVPVHILQNEDGSRQMIRDFEHQACLSCPCCIVWTAALQAMRDDVIKHSNGNHSRANRDPRCNVCLVAGGGIDQGRG